MNIPRSRAVPMTVDEYHLLPFEPGWKCEYWDGKAHYSPRYHAVVTAVAVAPLDVNTDCLLRQPAESDIEALMPVYVAAFRETIEYFGHSQEQIAEAARRDLRNYFAGEHGRPTSASCLAIAPGSNPDEEAFAGAAMVVPILVHLPKFYADVVLVPLGYLAVAIAVARSLDALSDPLVGWLSDRIGRELSAVITYGTSIFGVACALLIRGPDQHLLFWLHACFFGLTWGARGPSITAKTADLFSGSQLGTILGAITIGTGIGSAGGSWLAGWSFDLTGSYHLAFWLSIFFYACGSVAFWLLREPAVIRQ